MRNDTGLVGSKGRSFLGEKAALVSKHGCVIVQDLGQPSVSPVEQAVNPASKWFCWEKTQAKWSLKVLESRWYWPMIKPALQRGGEEKAETLELGVLSPALGSQTKSGGSLCILA